MSESTEFAYLDQKYNIFLVYFNLGDSSHIYYQSKVLEQTNFQFFTESYAV